MQGKWDSFLVTFPDGLLQLFQQGTSGTATLHAQTGRDRKRKVPRRIEVVNRVPESRKRKEEGKAGKGINASWGLCEGSMRQHYGESKGGPQEGSLKA
jgi:hypothetical protein